VRIGALTTHAELASSDLLKKSCPIVAEAAAKIGDQQVRNRGTIGGNLSHADPGSDLPAVVKALDATLHLVSKKGKRAVKAADFFLDLLSTDIRDGEILTAVEVPALGDGAGSCYLKFEHPASGYAVVGAAAIVRMKDGKCQDARLCFNGVTATPLDGGAVTKALGGKPLDDASVEQAMGGLTAADPLGDVFASGEYRLHLAKVYGRRALKLARDRAS
jgi:carbon-monoxide dehydrogenase medium subunit